MNTGVGNKMCYLVRGQMLELKEMYKAMGLFFNNDSTLNLAFNIEKDALFCTKFLSRKGVVYDPVIIQKHLGENHIFYGMCAASDFDQEYELEPNKCHVPLRFLDPPIARLCKIIGAMGFRTFNSCVGPMNEYYGTFFSFKDPTDIEKISLILNEFESELINFESYLNYYSWMGKVVVIKQKRPEFIVDDAYFWELQRLGDFLQAQVGVNFPLSFQSSYRPQSN